MLYVRISNDIFTEILSRIKVEVVRVSWGFSKVHLMTSCNVEIHKIQYIVTNLDLLAKWECCLSDDQAVQSFPLTSVFCEVLVIVCGGQSLWPSAKESSVLLCYGDWTCRFNFRYFSWRFCWNTGAGNLKMSEANLPKQAARLAEKGYSFWVQADQEGVCLVKQGQGRDMGEIWKWCSVL